VAQNLVPIVQRQGTIAIDRVLALDYITPLAALQRRP